MISSTSEYALRAVLHLAINFGRAETAQQIAVATMVPAGYMSKILQDLAKGGVVTSQRGPRGGFTLARSAEETSVLDVLNAVDPIKRIRACPLGLPEHGGSLCALHQRLDDALAYVEHIFAKSTMADLLKPSPVGARCAFPTGDEHARPMAIGGGDAVDPPRDSSAVPESKQSRKTS